MTSKVLLGLLLCYLMVRVSVPAGALQCFKCDNQVACRTCLSNLTSCGKASCAKGDECYKSNGTVVTEMGCKKCNPSDGCCKTPLCNGVTSALVPNRLGGGSVMLQVAAAAAILLPLWV